MPQWALWLVIATALGLGACSRAVGPSAIDDPFSNPADRAATRAPAGGTSGGMNAGVPGSF